MSPICIESLPLWYLFWPKAMACIVELNHCGILLHESISALDGFFHSCSEILLIIFRIIETFKSTVNKVFWWYWAHLLLTDGVNTFRNRQSSLPTKPLPSILNCGQGEPYLTASYLPLRWIKTGRYPTHVDIINLWCRLLIAM